MRLIRKASIAGAAIACTVLATTTGAHAEGAETDRQIAQSLFDDGRTLMEAGRYAEACPKFADSNRLEPAGGTLLNLALCHELEGKTATASTEFREALSLAMLAQRKDRQELAELHIAALAPKLTRLSVVVPQSMAGHDPEIVVDRSRLPSAAWNTAIPVDPGEHRIAMTATGLPRWETSVAMTEAGRTYTVAIPTQAASNDGPPAVLPSRAHRSTAFWLLLGGAGVSLATSVVTGILALNANAYVKDNCSTERSYCRVPDANDESTRARTLAWVSTVTLVTAAGAGAFAFVLPLDRSPLGARAGIRIQNGAAFATVSVAPLHW